jgi:hypothetical protein
MDKLTFHLKPPSVIKDMGYLLYRYTPYLAPAVTTIGITGSWLGGLVCSAAVAGLSFNSYTGSYLWDLHNAFYEPYQKHRVSKKVSDTLRDTLTKSGLAYLDKKEVHKMNGEKELKETMKYPKVKMTCDLNNYYLDIQMLHGQTTSQWESKSTAFANALKSDLVKFQVKRGNVNITLQHTELNTNEIPYKNDNLHDLTIGYTAGGLLKWDFNQNPHLLVIGVTSAGKSTFIRNLLIQFRKEWTLRIVDGKQVEFNFLRDYGYDVVTDKEDFVRYIDEAVDEMERRYEVMSNQRKNNYVDMAGMEPYFLLCDEWISLVESLNNKKKKDEEKSERDIFNEKLKKLTTKGRAAGVFMIAILQRPDTEFLGGMVRDMFTTKVVLKGSKAAFKMAFDDEGKDLVPLDKGQGYCMSQEIRNFSFPNYEMNHFIKDIERIGKRNIQVNKKIERFIARELVEVP